jgi:hypothetical protein
MSAYISQRVDNDNIILTTVNSVLVLLWHVVAGVTASVV